MKRKYELKDLMEEMNKVRKTNESIKEMQKKRDSMIAKILSSFGISYCTFQSYYYNTERRIKC